MAKNVKKNNVLSKNIPSPHDAIVRGVEIMFLAVEEMSFRVIASTSFKNFSMGSLQCHGS